MPLIIEVAAAEGIAHGVKVEHLEHTIIATLEICSRLAFSTRPSLNVSMGSIVTTTLEDGLLVDSRMVKVRSDPNDVKTRRVLELRLKPIKSSYRTIQITLGLKAHLEKVLRIS